MKTTLIFPLSIVLLARAGVGAVEAPAGPEARNERYSARVVEVSGYNDFRSTFEILDLASGAKKLLTFTMRALSYDQILIRPGVAWAVAVGRLPRGGYSLAVIDLEKARHVDTIWCYDFSLSPSGRWLIYDSHFPKMGLPAYRRSILILYDLSRGAAANRPPGVAGFSHDNAGIPVFPRANREAGSYDVALDREHQLMRPKLWLPNQKGVVFLEFRDSDRENFLVRLDFGSEGVERQVESLVPLEPLLDRAKMHAEAKDRIERRGLALFPQILEWVAPGRSIRLVPWEEPWLQKEVLLSVPQSP